MEGIITLHDLTEAILGELPEEDEEIEFNLIERSRWNHPGRRIHEYR
jgi:CBS domain containing-hemolysin-like protein